MTVHHGCSLEVLKTLEPDSVDSVVTDPPYGWRFMGKAWDAFDIDRLIHKEIIRKPRQDIDTRTGKPRVRGREAASLAGKYDNGVDANRAFQAFTEEWAREAYRVLKPGGHMVVFCGPRTYHRMASGVEDAGFEIRDQLQWLFGSGFPKSMDVSKAIDKAAGAEREVIGPSDRHGGVINNVYGEGMGDGSKTFITAPATEDAKKWQGWGTALKPANEPIVLARKPLSEKTVAKNVVKHGTGSLNIDASRINLQIGETTHGSGKSQSDSPSTAFGDMGEKRIGVPNIKSSQGRWPSNVLLACDCETDTHVDDCAVGELDKQSETLSGGASRFFKVVKHDPDDTFASWTNSADIAETTSTPLEQLEDSVQSLVAISEVLAVESSSDMIYLSTLGIVSALRQNDASGMRRIPSIAEKFLRELKRIETSTLDHAIIAAIEKLIATTTTILSLSKSNSFVEAVTLMSTSASAAHGVDRFGNSRFAYVAKTSKRERNAGLEGMPKQMPSNAIDRATQRNGEEYASGRGSKSGPRENHHPTVKPIKLMEYLIRLITPSGGLVLDPFTGSGSTGVAAVKCGFEFVGIEKELEYVEIARKRIDHVR